MKLIEEAARRQGSSVSQFVREAALMPATMAANDNPYPTRALAPSLGEHPPEPLGRDIGGTLTGAIRRSEPSHRTTPHGDGELGPRLGLAKNLADVVAQFATEE